MKQEILQTVTQLEAQKVTGAKGLLSCIERTSGLDFQNTMTEAFAVHFVAKELNFTITQIEGSLKVLSPHRTKEKSCDMKCEDQGGSEIFFEVKDFSRELIIREKAGIRGYTPPTGEETKRWISNKVFEAIRKGANYLIVRIPVWHDAYEEPKSNDIDFAIFRTHEKQDEIPVTLSIEVPSFFRGMYVIQPFGHRFYTPRKVQPVDPPKKECS